MTIEGIDGIFLETHNWGQAAKYYQALGFELDFATDHGSGLLRHRTGPYVFLVEVPADQEARTQFVLKVTDEQAFQPDAVLEVLTEFEDTHYGTREMLVRDPDGRLWNLQAPGKD
ncbi:VOC family protein [Nocardia sp. NBC_01327]|uniref:VOC family protein n=1 Tax=Nocardia sp. NBC_01327 TaxID=2903593 RepID=UPI002E0D7BEA|nr:VOC family protein [Nocardia sp. NBC_01327]